ncbi:MAG: hypothetical protein BWK78_03820 [Thiotrichaceae bacterium IS1]|nr:MAG: hypothetical protein BWK78_03820 [Thiotrichaceae bacterium IS1]
MIFKDIKPAWSNRHSLHKLFDNKMPKLKCQQGFENFFWSYSITLLVNKLVEIKLSSFLKP